MNRPSWTEHDGEWHDASLDDKGDLRLVVQAEDDDARGVLLEFQGSELWGADYSKSKHPVEWMKRALEQGAAEWFTKGLQRLRMLRSAVEIAHTYVVHVDMDAHRAVMDLAGTMGDSPVDAIMAAVHTLNDLFSLLDQHPPRKLALVDMDAGEFQEVVLRAKPYVISEEEQEANLLAGGHAMGDG